MSQEDLLKSEIAISRVDSEVFKEPTDRLITLYFIPGMSVESFLLKIILKSSGLRKRESKIINTVIAYVK